MVLQRHLSVPIWGTADPNERVTVTLDQQKVIATADNEGNWNVKLRSLKAGGPHELTVAGKNKIVLKNVMVGDVWVCSGQSNMQWNVQNSINAEKEIAEAQYPMIRLFTVNHVVSDKPLKDTKGKWDECSPKTVPGFSAVGYFFGRDLYKALNVPIGLINTS